MSENIGFIGLGEMGLPMVLNLQKSGFQVFAFDINQTNYKMLRQSGVICCDSIKELTESADKSVVSIVRTAEQTREVIFGEKGITSADKQGINIIIMSTLDPSTMLELSDEVDDKGYHLVDAPISGSLSGAKAATLTFMTAGNEEVVKQCDQYFLALGKNIFYFGKQCGSGQAAKLTNNLVLAINIVGCTEALKFGRENKLPTEEILKLLSVSTGNSWVLNNWEEVKNYTPETALGIVYKDLTAILKECSKTQVSLPLGELTTHRLFEAMEENRE